MPIHFSDVDVIPELEGVGSALVVPCYMCPAATVAVREHRPFMQLHKSLVASAPFEEYVAALQARLGDEGIETEVFKSRLYHQWFLCMWSVRRRRKLRDRACDHDAVVVLGCESATATVREAAASTGCRIVEGMQVTGIMNAKMRVRVPGNITFEECAIVPIGRSGKTESVAS